jgi:tetratricopeptide (TPR) repeat protein
MSCLSLPASSRKEGGCERQRGSWTAFFSSAPDEPLALHEKGVLLFRMGHQEAAAETIERPVSLAPDATLFRRNLCPIYERLGRYDDALRVGHEALDRASFDPQTLHNLALTHYRKLELDESVTCARRALELNPCSGSAFPAGRDTLASALRRVRGGLERV